MTRYFPTTLCLLMAVGSMLPLAGCGPSASEQNADTAAGPVDPHDVPISEEDVTRPLDYADAVARIQLYRDKIRDEIAAGNPSLAHRPLDELNFVLEWLPGIARDSEIPKQRWGDINTTAQGLRELFDKVHANIDARRDPDYASVSDRIDANIERLEGFGS